MSRADWLARALAVAALALGLGLRWLIADAGRATDRDPMRALEPPGATSALVESVTEKPNPPPLAAVPVLASESPAPGTGETGDWR